jgi:hypothetical protein
MNDRKNSSGQSGYSKALSFTAIAVTAVLVMGAAAALVPTPAATEAEVQAASTTSYDESVGYLPAQVANQAKEIEPMPEMYF